jgi:hypothetical protein
MGGQAIALDTCLGVPGLPQSATGQTAIFTGVNTPASLGRHLSGFPNKYLRSLLRRDSIFIRLVKAGLKTTFANAFTPAYFLLPINRMSASSLHMLYAGLMPRWIWNIPSGKALFQDFTNRTLIEAGFNLPELSPETAGHNLAALLGEHDFVLYEYFLTDAAAHGRIRQSPEAIVKHLDRMVTAVLQTVDLERHAVALCSDHGNIEDPSVRTHTGNAAPMVAWGHGKERLLDGLESLTGIRDAVCRYLLG